MDQPPGVCVCGKPQVHTPWGFFLAILTWGNRDLGPPWSSRFAVFGGDIQLLFLGIGQEVNILHRGHEGVLHHLRPLRRHAGRSNERAPEVDRGTGIRSPAVDLEAYVGGAREPGDDLYGGSR